MLCTMPCPTYLSPTAHPLQLIFEIRDLRYATPATATRAGILYISEGQQWVSLVESWLRRVVRWGAGAGSACWATKGGKKRADVVGAQLSSSVLHPSHSCLTLPHPPRHRRPYAEKAKWADPDAPVRTLRDLFARYVPPTLFELRKSFIHMVPVR